MKTKKERKSQGEGWVRVVRLGGGGGGGGGGWGGSGWM